MFLGCQTRNPVNVCVCVCARAPVHTRVSWPSAGGQLHFISDLQHAHKHACDRGDGMLGSKCDLLTPCGDSWLLRHPSVPADGLAVSGGLLRGTAEGRTGAEERTVLRALPPSSPHGLQAGEESWTHTATDLESPLSHPGSAENQRRRSQARRADLSGLSHGSHTCLSREVLL
jgi:hypothetical protein